MAHIGYAVTNGGTLEDCHTNVFLLTELNGLKWCKFSLPPNFNANFSDTCDDPILNAYSQCLKHGVPSVWRRIPQAQAAVSSQNVNNSADQLNNFSSNTQNKTDFRLNTEKELQVFWYGEEPDWTLLATSNLSKSCKGSWEDGIDYETRTLLFKSLHNLIEKCLLGNRYVRLGRWFLKPLPSNSASNDKQLLAFSLSFFIHGENDVCVCVNVQKQPAVYQLSYDIQVDKQSLSSQQPSNTSASLSGAKRSVILSPWSIKGYANLDEFKYVDSEQVKARKMEILREWAKFYPLTATEDSNVKNEDSDIAFDQVGPKISFASNLQMLPNGNLPVIEVNVGGVKILYPSFYVLMAPQDEKTDSTNQNSATNRQRNFGVFSSSNRSSVDGKSTSAVRKMKPSTLGRLQRRILERIEEELTLNKTGCGSMSDFASEFTSNLWNLTELPNNPLLIPSLPAEKETCRCPLYPLSSTMLLPGSSAGGNGGGQSSPQVPNKAQLKFGLAASIHAIGNVCKVKQDRRDKLQKCGAFHKRQSMSAAAAATPIAASLDSKNSLASMAQYVAPIAVTVAPSASIQMISPVASSTNVASIMQPFNDSSVASVNTPLYTSQQTLSYHFPENPGSEISLAENPKSKMVPSPSTLIGTKSIAKLASSDRERFSLLEQPCSSSSSSTIILKRSLTENRVNRIILPYRRTKNSAKKNLTCADQKRSSLLSDQSDRNRSKDEPLESLSFYDNNNNNRDENFNTNSANFQFAATYQSNNLVDFRPENNFPRQNWIQSSMNGPVHPYMCDYGRTDFVPRNPPYASTQYRAFPRKSPVPPVHPQACDTKVNLWTATGAQHPKSGQNARIVGEVNSHGAMSSSQSEPINDSRLFQTCDTFGANTTMLTMEHQQWITPPQGPMQFPHVQHSVQNEPNMHAMPLHLQQHSAMNYPSVDLQYNYQQLPQQQPIGQFTTTMTNVSHQMAMPENIMADSGGSDSEEDHTTFLSPPPSHGQEEDMMAGRKTKTVNSTPSCNSSLPSLQQQQSEAAKRPAVASLLDYGIYPTPPSVDGATQFSPESCSTTSGRLEAHTINAHYATNATSQNTRPTVETNESPADKITCDNRHFPIEQNSSKYKLSDELSTILLEFAQSSKFNHVIEVSKSRSSLSRFLSSHSTKRKFDTANNKKSVFLEYKPNNIILFNHHHAANNNLYNSPIGQILQTTSSRNQTFSSPIFSPPSKFAGFPFSPSSGGRHPSGGGPSSVNPLSALASLPQPLPSFSPAQSLQLQRQQPPPPQFVDRSPLPQNSPYSMAKTPKTPMGLDLQSPLSNASSHYTNRNHGSIGGISSSVYTNFSPEANGLYLSLLLCDTFLNLHKDCVFDSCPLCVCCMNIQGSFAEVSLYLLSQPSALGSNDQNYQQNTSKCSCGFSASRNRYLTYKSGQFYEDECEVTGLWPGAKRNNFGDESLNLLGQDRVPFDIIELIRSYSLMPDFHLMLPVVNWRLFSQERRKNPAITRRDNKISEKTQDLQTQPYDYSELELNDFAEYCNMALEQASMIGDCTTPSRDDLSKSKTTLVHSWAFLKARKPISSVDAVSLIRNLLPMLQESVQKPRSVHQSKHSVEGPLTWRQFHRKCSHRISNSGREDLSGPEPVPTLLVSVEKEWVSLSPFSLRFWDRLSLEPFGQTKDVAYVVVLPDNPSLAHKARIFFRELSKTYESMRLGRHCPLSKVLKDGLMRVSKTRVSQVTNLSVDPWFERLEQACQASNRTASCSASDNVGGCELSSSTAAAPPTLNPRQILAQKYKVYAQVCRHSLAPHLAEHIFDRTIFRDQSRENAGANVSSINSSGDSTMPPPATPSPSGPFYDSGQESMYSDVSGCEVSLDPNSLDYAPPVPHVTVVYLVNAFTYGLETGENADDDRLTSTALFRCYLEVLNGMPLAARAHVQLQIVPLQAVMDFSCPNNLISIDDMTPVTRSIHRQPSPSQSEYYRQLALDVFSHSRSVGSQFLLGFQAKPLTAIGPAAARIEIIKRKMEASAVDPNRSIYRMYCPAVVLASSIGEQQQAAAAATVPLLASSSANFGAVTAGEESARVLFVTYCPSDNLNSSSQSQRCWLLAAATDHQGVLLENCVIDTNINNRWCAARRSVIFEALKKLWDFICGLLSNGCQPWRLVIGRLGRIGHDELKVWAHLLNKNQLRATSRLLRDHCGICSAMPGFQETPCILSACLISTEADAHLRVFPDSFAYDERFGQSAKQCPLSTPEDVSCTHLMVFPTSAFQMSQNGVVSNSGIGPMDDIDEFNMNWDIPDGIDGIDDGNLNELLGESGFDGGNIQNRMPEATDDSIQLQPLALGYIVSTAPIEHAPDFFWSYCPSARYTNPVHLRSALHINTSAVQQNDDQFLTNAGKNASNINNHALDSSLTTDVLRYALETYNALSWLSLNPSTGDRRSCLPIHMQALCRLHRTLNRLL